MLRKGMFLSTIQPEMPFITIGTATSAGWYSTDLGDNWIAVDWSPYTPTLTMSSFQSFNTTASMMHRDKQHIAIAATSSGGGLVCVSDDGGESFGAATLMGAINVYYPYWSYDGSLRIGGWAQSELSPDFGATFSNIDFDGGGYAVSFANSDSDQYVYAGQGATADAQVSDDYGATWTRNAMNGSHTYVICDATGQYAITGYGNFSNDVYFSDDYGSSWSTLSTGEGRGIITRDANTMIFYNESSTGIMYVSTDQGSSWNTIPSQFDSSILDGVQFFDTFDNEIIAAVSGQAKVCKLNSAKDNWDVYPTDYDLFTFGMSAFGRGFVYSTPVSSPYRVMHSYNLTDWTEIYYSTSVHPRYVNCQ